MNTTYEIEPDQRFPVGCWVCFTCAAPVGWETPDEPVGVPWARCWATPEGTYLCERCAPD